MGERWVSALARRVAVPVVLLIAAPARAEPSEADALFSQGRELLEKGRFLEACEKLRRSEELAPAVGTLLNLGFCYEQTAKLRSAMEAYSEAEILARPAYRDYVARTPAFLPGPRRAVRKDGADEAG